jgi:hypothetical protein
VPLIVRETNGYEYSHQAPFPLFNEALRLSAAAKRVVASWLTLQEKNVSSAEVALVTKKLRPRPCTSKMTTASYGTLHTSAIFNTILQRVPYLPV